MAEEWSGDELVEMFYELRARQRRDGGGDWLTPVIGWPELWGEDMTEAAWLLEPILPVGRSVAMFAKGGTGKSLFALWMAAGIAAGRPLFGRQTSGVPVLYFDYEMTRADLRERLEDMDYGPAQLGNLHYALMPTLDPLDSEAGGAAVVRMAERCNAALVVVDTFARAVEGDENEADTVRNWYRYTGMGLKDAGRAFLRIDHAGKDLAKGQRGSSAKADDVDVVWQMTAHDDEMYRLTATKRRVGWVPPMVEMTKVEDPCLGYELVLGDTLWPAGTADLAATLDKLEIPLDWGRRRVAPLVRGAGYTARNINLEAAIKWRRESAKNVSQNGGDTPPVDKPRGTESGHVEPNMLLPAGDTFGDTVGHTPSVPVGTHPCPPKGGTVSQHPVSDPGLELY